MIYLLTKDEQNALFSLNLLHVSNRLTMHHQEVVYCICSIWCLSCWKYIKIA